MPKLVSSNLMALLVLFGSVRGGPLSRSLVHRPRSSVLRELSETTEVLTASQPKQRKMSKNNGTTQKSSRGVLNP